MELVLPRYNVHPYFSLKNLGKKVHIIHGKNGILVSTFHIQVKSYGIFISRSDWFQLA